MDIWKKIFLMPCMLLVIFFTVSINAEGEYANAKCKVQNASFKMAESQTTSNTKSSAECDIFPSNKRGEGYVQSEIQNVPSTLIGDLQSKIATLQSAPHHPQINKAEFTQKIQKLQMPFIANNGQLDETVKFYAKTFAGSVFVTNDGEIVYSLPSKISKSEGWHGQTQFVREEERSDCKGNPLYPPSSLIPSDNLRLILKEEFVGGKINEIKGESQSVTKVNYFKGNDPSQWKTNVSTYEWVNLGEVYDGIGLSLKAYGNNVEKLFTVKPGASPDQIKISMGDIQPPESPFIKGDSTTIPLNKCGKAAKSPLEKGARGLWVNERGELVVETGLGDVKFSKPVAYQVIDGKRVEVEVEYSVQKSEDRSQNIDRNHINSKSEVHNLKTSDSSHVAAGSMPASGGDRPVGLVKRSTPNKQPPASPFSKGDFSNDGFAAINPSYPWYKGMVRRLCKLQNSKTETRNIQLSTLLAQNYSLNHNSQLSTQNPEFIYGFKVATYDKTKALIIDPLLASTFLGGSGEEHGILSIAIDPVGNIFVAGSTYSSDFPTTVGVYDTSYNPGGPYPGDAYVAKLSGDLTSLIASTYLGGSSWDNIYSLAISSEGNVYVSGETRSSDFPTTTSAYDTSFNSSGLTEAFISEFNGNLTDLLASTYLGGSDADHIDSVVIDLNGNILLTGRTLSSDFQTTTGAYDTSYNGSYDIFLSRLNEGLTNLLASTYLGGSGDEHVDPSIAIDSNGNIYVAGGTYSSDFPTSVDAYGTSYNPGGPYPGDAYVAKLSGDLTSLIASTYLGGSSWDNIYSLAISSGGNVYVSGETRSSDFPTTTSAYDTSFNSSGLTEAFISELNGNLTDLLASTYLGGSDADHIDSVVIDSNGNILLTGGTLSSDFPTTTGAYDIFYNGGSDDAFVSKLNGSLTSLLASTYLGGSGGDSCYSMAGDSSGNIFVAGRASSPDFPTTTGVYDTSLNGYSDVFISKLDGNLTAAGEDPQPVANAGEDQTVDEGELVSLLGSGTAPQGVTLTYQWTQVAGPIVTLFDPNSPTPTFTAPLVNANVTLTFQLTVSYDNYSSLDTIDVTIVNVNHAPIAYTGDDQTVDEGTLVTLHGETSYDPDGNEITYQWTQVSGPTVTLSGSNSTNPTFTVPDVTTATLLVFELVVSDGELSSRPAYARVTVEHVNHPPVADATGSTQTVNEDSTVSLDGSQSYDSDGDSITCQWTQVSGPTVILSNSNSANPSFTAPQVTETTYLEFELVVSDRQLSSAPVRAMVTVLDTNQPVDCSSAAPSIATLWPPNHKLVSVGIVGVTDPDNEGVTITITRVTQDEPVEGLGDGDTGPDAVIQGDTVLLRAERSGTGDGRVYEIHFMADDGQGSTCQGSVKVSVPRDMKKIQGLSIMVRTMILPNNKLSNLKQREDRCLAA